MADVLNCKDKSFFNVGDIFYCTKYKYIGITLGLLANDTTQKFGLRLFEYELNVDGHSFKFGKREADIVSQLILLYLSRPVVYRDIVHIRGNKNLYLGKVNPNPVKRLYIMSATKGSNLPALTFDSVASPKKQKWENGRVLLTKEEQFSGRYGRDGKGCKFILLGVFEGTYIYLRIEYIHYYQDESNVYDAQRDYVLNTCQRLFDNGTYNYRFAFTKSLKKLTPYSIAVVGYSNKNAVRTITSRENSDGIDVSSFMTEGLLGKIYNLLGR